MKASTKLCAAPVAPPDHKPADKSNAGAAIGRMSEIDENIQRTFDIRRRLGKGAYGIVWKALDRNTAQTVAVKKIFDAFRNETDAQRTFREVMFLRSFRNHPNIVRLYSIHRAANHMDIYLSFEFMESDLHNVIKRGAILKDIHKRFVMYQLLNATQYIHSGNVIHRDMKPSNVLIDSKCRCKIADFGLARSVGQQSQQSNDADFDAPCLTDYVATRWYRAPEILVASKRYTMGIDMWSLGCILGEMMLGRPLFPGSCTVNQIERIVGALPAITEADIAAVGNGFGTALLTQAKPAAAGKATSTNGAGGSDATAPASLDEMLVGAPADARELVNALLRLDPTKRLTAKHALGHRYIDKFRNTLSECELSGDILQPFSDNVQLTVSEYRSKLYEIMNEKGCHGGYVGTSGSDRPSPANRKDNHLESSISVTNNHTTSTSTTQSKHQRVSVSSFASQHQRQQPQQRHHSTSHNSSHHPPKPSSTTTITSTASKNTNAHAYAGAFSAALPQAAANGKPPLATSTASQNPHQRSSYMPSAQHQHHQHHRTASSSSTYSLQHHNGNRQQQQQQQQPPPPYRKSVAINRELLNRLDEVANTSNSTTTTTSNRRKSLEASAIISYPQQQQHSNHILNHQQHRPQHQRRQSHDGATTTISIQPTAAAATNDRSSSASSPPPPPTKQMRALHQPEQARLVPSMSKHRLLNVLNNRMHPPSSSADQQQQQQQQQQQRSSISLQRQQPASATVKSRSSMLCFKASVAAGGAQTPQQPPAAASFDARLRVINEKLNRHIVGQTNPKRPANQQQQHHLDMAAFYPSESKLLLAATLPGGIQSQAKSQHPFRAKSDSNGNINGQQSQHPHQHSNGHFDGGGDGPHNNGHHYSNGYATKPAPMLSSTAAGGSCFMRSKMRPEQPPKTSSAIEDRLFRVRRPSELMML